MVYVDDVDVVSTTFMTSHYHSIASDSSDNAIII